jgi:CcmD family protein
MKTKYIAAKITLLLTLIFLSVSTFAQDAVSDQIEMADALLANGKIYIVVAVLCIIFIGIVIYLIRLDKKIHELEKQK